MSIHARSYSTALTLLAALGLASVCSFNTACSSGSRRSNTAAVTTTGGGAGGGGGGGGGGTTAPTVSYSISAITTALSFTTLRSNVAALGFTLSSANGAATVRSMTFVAAGTVDETIFGQALLVRDANGNNVIEAAELAAPVATKATPAFTSNNGTLNFSGFSISLVAGTPQNFFVVLDGTAATVTPAMVGQTINLRLDAANKIDAVDSSNSQAIVVNGDFTSIYGPIPGGLHDHLLITEVIWTPTASEYIEIFNPTPLPVQLSNYHLTDITVSGANKYWNVPQLTQVGPLFNQSGVGDFHVVFPSSTIASGETIIVAINGAGFAAAFAANTARVFCMSNPSAGQIQMRTITSDTGLPGGIVFGTNPISPSSATTPAMLTNSNETVVLAFWDGSSDLMIDIDYVGWGTTTTGNPSPDKTNEAIDGPDNGGFGVAGDTTTYRADTASAAQQRASSAGSGVQRTNYTEGTETQTNGNGFNGDDETSENLTATFQTTTTPTPGVLN